MGIWGPKPPKGMEKIYTTVLAVVNEDEYIKGTNGESLMFSICEREYAAEISNMCFFNL